MDMWRDSAEKVAKVREAIAGDAESIHALAIELARAVGDSAPHPADVRTRLEDLIREPRAQVLVAESEGELVGAVSLWIKPDLAHGDVIVEVPMLIVVESYRRCGVGRLLMDGVRRTAAEAGAGVIELVAARSNEPARRFYRSLGFIESDHVTMEFLGDMKRPPNPEE